MQKLSKLILLVIILFMVSCKADNKSLIAKKWKFDVESMKKAMDEEMSKKSEEEQKQGKAMQEMIVGMLGMVTMEFKADGSMESGAMGQVTKGTWTLSDDGKTLTTKEEGKDEQKMNIKEINADKLVFTSDKNDSPIKDIVLIPAN